MILHPHSKTTNVVFSFGTMPIDGSELVGRRSLSQVRVSVCETTTTR